MSKKYIIPGLGFFLIIFSTTLFIKPDSSKIFFNKLQSKPHISIHYINPERQYKYKKFFGKGVGWNLSEFSYLPMDKSNNISEGKLMFKLNDFNNKTLVIYKNISLLPKTEIVDSLAGGSVTNYQNKYNCSVISFMPGKNNQYQDKQCSIVNLYVLSGKGKIDHYILLIFFIKSSASQNK